MQTPKSVKEAIDELKEEIFSKIVVPLDPGHTENEIGISVRENDDYDEYRVEIWNAKLTNIGVIASITYWKKSKERTIQVTVNSLHKIDGREVYGSHSMYIKRMLDSETFLGLFREIQEKVNG